MKKVLILLIMMNSLSLMAQIFEIDSLTRIYNIGNAYYDNSMYKESINIYKKGILYFEQCENKLINYSKIDSVTYYMKGWLIYSGYISNARELNMEYNYYRQEEKKRDYCDSIYNNYKLYTKKKKLEELLSPKVLSKIVFNLKDTIIQEGNIIKELIIDTILSNVSVYSSMNYELYRSNNLTSNLGLLVTFHKTDYNYGYFNIKTQIINTQLFIGQKISGDLVIYICKIKCNNYLIEERNEYDLINIKYE